MQETNSQTHKHPLHDIIWCHLANSAPFPWRGQWADLAWRPQHFVTDPRSGHFPHPLQSPKARSTFCPLIEELPEFVGFEQWMGSTSEHCAGWAWKREEQEWGLDQLRAHGGKGLVTAPALHVLSAPYSLNDCQFTMENTGKRSLPTAVQLTKMMTLVFYITGFILIEK